MPRARRIYHIGGCPRRWFRLGYFHFTELTEGRWTCCRTYRLSTNPGRCDLPVIFQTLAYINPDGCFLTEHGDHLFLGDDTQTGGCMGSCWLDPCDNPLSRRFWRRGQRNILELRTRAGVPLNTPFIFRPSQTRCLLSMQVSARYEPYTEVSSCHSLLSCSPLTDISIP